MLRLRGTWMRGGTSKCWLFEADEFMASGAEPGEVLPAVFGAADPQQIDGVGGATSTTSKAAIVGRSGEPGIDVQYTFAQVGIGAASVEWGSNCGNCATAIGLYSLQAGLVTPQGPRTAVRMRNLNTGALLTATVATPDGSVPESGSAIVPGVSVGGVPVELTFEEPAGSTTGRLLPTGRPVDELAADGLRARATLIDAGAPVSLVDAAALGWSATEADAVFAGRVGQLTKLRRAAALAMGLASADDVVSHAIPKIGMVGPAADYVARDGRPIDADDYDIAVRMVSMHAPHPSVGLTSAVALAAAAAVPGSVPAGVMPDGSARVVRLGTPAGVVHVRADVDPDGRLRAVSMAWAARRIAVAELYVPPLLRAQSLVADFPA